MTENIKCTQFYKTATFYFNIIWYSIFIPFILDKHNEKLRELLLGVSVHVVPFIIISHFILWHTPYYNACCTQLNRHIIDYMFLGDVIPHYLIFILYIIYFKKINKKVNVRSPYFLTGLIGTIILLILYGFVINWNFTIYHESFLVLGILYFLILCLTFTILLKEKIVNIK